jgi:hypothetical protein
LDWIDGFRQSPENRSFSHTRSLCSLSYDSGLIPGGSWLAQLRNNFTIVLEHQQHHHSGEMTTRRPSTMAFVFVPRRHGALSVALDFF